MEAPGRRTGTRFGPYELRTLLGKGGMGEVYRAYDTVKDRMVALKLLSEELAKDQVYQVRFRRESQAASRLAEPHIIPIHGWGVIDGVLFIDMRLVTGADLRTLLRAGGPLSPARAVSMVEQVAAALDAAHASGLVHRDVKPANILVTPGDFAYLVDFGIAHTEGDSAITMVGMAVGSYTYMAPERFDVGPVTRRADIYSLACVLHECLTGAAPFAAASMNVLVRLHLSDPPPRPSLQRQGISAALDEVIARGMAKRAEDRFPTATSLARAARAALTPTPPAPRPKLVVRAPDQAWPGAADAAADRGSMPPESTGELVIHPSAPTVVRPTETQFTSLPPADQVPVEPPSPPVRPFPDAHLYPEDQRYPQEQAGSGAQSYPSVQETRAHSVPPVRPFPDAHLFPDDQPYPDEPPRQDAQSYSSAQQVAQAYSQFEDVSAAVARHQVKDDQSYRDAQLFVEREFVSGGESFAAAESAERDHLAPDQLDQDRYRAEYRAPADHSAPVELPAEGDYPQHAERAASGGYRARAEYRPRSEHEPRDPALADYPDDPDDAYTGDPDDSPAQGGSIMMPIMVAVLAIVVLGAVGAVSWQVLGSHDSGTTGSGNQSATTSPAPIPAATIPGTSAMPPATAAAPTTTPVALPVGAEPCDEADSGIGALAHTAVGSAVTSCGFAEAVRKAYAESSTATNVARTAPRAVVATSPVTGRTYTMNCTIDGRLVTCVGGDNAVVYLY